MLQLYRCPKSSVRPARVGLSARGHNYNHYLECLFFRPRQRLPISWFFLSLAGALRYSTQLAIFCASTVLA